MLVSYFNKCVIMRLLVKLDFSKYYKEPSRVSYPGMPLWEGGHPSLAPSPYGGCVAILCGGLPPHLCHGLASFPGLSREGKAWGLLRAHARKIPFIFRIIRRKISDNDVIVHGESARPRGKSMRTH